MITGFSYDTVKGEWMADWQSNNRWSFKNLYNNSIGYFIKIGKKEYYLTDEEVNRFKQNKKALHKQMQ
jgi:hypothetical protein